MAEGMAEGTVHIIGAGLAGLSTAVRLVERGRRVVLHEAFFTVHTRFWKKPERRSRSAGICCLSRRAISPYLRSTEIAVRPLNDGVFYFLFLSTSTRASRDLRTIACLSPSWRNFVCIT